MSLMPVRALMCDKCRACVTDGYGPALFSTDDVGDRAAAQWCAEQGWTKNGGQDLCPECSPKPEPLRARHSWWFACWPWSR